MANNNLNTAVKKLNMVGLPCNMQVRFVQGKNEKQAVRTILYIDGIEKLNISTSAFVGADFELLFDQWKNDMLEDTSMATSRVEDAWEYGDIGEQYMTYVKDKEDKGLAIDSTDDMRQYVLRLTYNYGYDYDFVINQLKKLDSKEQLEFRKNLVVINNDCFLTKHIFNKALKNVEKINKKNEFIDELEKLRV